MRAIPVVIAMFVVLAASAVAWKLFPQDQTEDPGQALAERLRAAEPQETRPTSPSPSETTPTVAEEAPVTVEVVEVTPQNLEEEVITTGELKADEEVELRSQASGRVVAINFAEGSSVQKGELLVKIDDSELQAQLKRAVVERDLAETQAERARRLFDQDTISREEMEEARADLDVREAEIELIRARIEQTELRAPFDGTVGLRWVSVGSYLTPNVPIATLQSLNPIKIDFAAAEKYAGKIRRGHSVDVTVAGIDGHFQGTVYAVEPRVNAETRTIQLRARTPNPGRRLLPGAFAQVRVVLESSSDALLVPAIALVPGQAQTRVFVVEEGHAQPRTVTVGRRTEAQVEIVQGLTAGDRVITSGVLQVRPGNPVEVL